MTTSSAIVAVVGTTVALYYIGAACDYLAERWRRRRRHR